MNADLAEFEEKIELKFNNKKYLIQAFSHSSYVREHGLTHESSNERLEFLGDAVLELVSSEFLYFKYKDKDEGWLSKLRANLVCEPTLAECARRIDLQDYIMLGKGEDKNGGRQRESIVSDCMEAVIGAIFLDRGIKKASEFIKKYILFDVENMHTFSDNKSELQMILQAKGSIPRYNLIKEEGPSHDKTFYVEVRDREQLLGKGIGHSKKAAEQKAAKEAINTLKKKDKNVS